LTDAGRDGLLPPCGTVALLSADGSELVGVRGADAAQERVDDAGREGVGVSAGAGTGAGIRAVIYVPVSVRASGPAPILGAASMSA
jgi:hypothetical protein